ncbi:MAG: guanylate kinase, partial [Gemmatimonadota bacterium]
MIAEGNGMALVLSGPSGGGKTSVCDALQERRTDVEFSISATSRSPRPGEVDGMHYHFVSRDRFREMARNGDLLEWAEVHGELYGTPLSNLGACTDSGRTLLLDIDVQGARQVRRNLESSVLVFLLPPSAERLLERLRRRGSEDTDALQRRMRSALSELEAVGEFDYALVNEDLR